MEKNLLLLIEDNPLLTGLYKAAFEKAGINVLIAHDGKRGLELAKEKHPSVIVLDFLMIGMNGLEVLQLLKSDPATQNIKVIMLTVASEQQDKDKAKELGAVDYLTKSELSVNDIVEKVTKHL